MRILFLLVLAVSMVFISFTEVNTKASYYGKEHHGKRTANKEKFNMYEFTAAHKSLPFNTMIKVTNVENGKSTTVRINDRGPFVKSRGLDLSYAAFKEIANPKVGVINITYSIIE